MRTLIDIWWPLLQAGAAEAIVSNVSGCGLMLKEYGHALRDDPDCAEKAAFISQHTRDISELLPDIAAALAHSHPQLGQSRRLNYHPPCTLQHGQKLRGGVEQHLTALGFDVALAAIEPHLCCGSAGTYSVTQPDLAQRLRTRKLAALQQRPCETIVSANIGCIAHLQAEAAVPVQHWIEVLDAALQAAKDAESQHQP